MSLMEKLINGFKTKQEQATVEDLTEIKNKLKAIVYDDEVVEELAPVFAKLQSHEGFDKVWELVECKEQQINALSKDGYWSQQQTKPDVAQEPDENGADSNDDDLVNSLIKQKYSHGEK